MIIRYAVDGWRPLRAYRADITRYVAQAGPYSHNLVSITLRQIERQFGAKAAREAIEDFDLGKKFGIKGRTG